MEETKLERDYEEEMYDDENIPEGYFAAAYYRYLRSYQNRRKTPSFRYGDIRRML